MTNPFCKALLGKGLPFLAAGLLVVPGSTQGSGGEGWKEARMREEYQKASRGFRVPVIQARELLVLLDTPDLVLIDTRETKEQAVSMLPRALTEAQFWNRYPGGVAPSKRVVAYCTIGFRSGKFVEGLARLGTKAENLEGGILAWSFVGGPLQTRNDAGSLIPTRRIHTYARKWNIVPKSYEGVW